MIRALRSRGLIAGAAHRYRPYASRNRRTPEYLVSPAPAAPTISRRGALAFAGAGSLLLLALSVGQSLGGPLRRTALLAPHGQDLGAGPNDFQINQTAAEVGHQGGGDRRELAAHPRPAPAGTGPRRPSA